jgi:hypothetical protein
MITENENRGDNDPVVKAHKQLLCLEEYKRLYMGIPKKHPKCKGYKTWEGEFDCAYDTTLDCEDCKYGLGRKDPKAKCNRMRI